MEMLLLSGHSEMESVERDADVDLKPTKGLSAADAKNGRGYLPRERRHEPRLIDPAQPSILSMPAIRVRL